MTEGGWFDEEAIEAERLDADIEQAELEDMARAGEEEELMTEGPTGNTVLHNCPVIVMKGEDDTERCNEPVGIWTEHAPSPVFSSTRTYVIAGCANGHTADEMQRDINRDLDGVPL